MDHQGKKFEKDQLKITVSKTCDEVVHSNFRRLVSRKQSASSISIPMASLEIHVENNGGRHSTRPLHSVNATQGPTAKTEKHKHLMRSKELGMCNVPFCDICPTYLKPSDSRTTEPSTQCDPKFHNNLYGDAKGNFGRKVISFLSSYVPGVINPHAKLVQNWSIIFATFFLVEMFIDPILFFSIYVNKDDKCIAVNWTATKASVLFRTINDLAYYFHIFLQFRIAYVASESRELVDDPKEIAKKYLKGYFLYDLYVVFPFPLMLKFALPHYVRLSGVNYGKRLGVSLCVQSLFRLGRYLQIERSISGIRLERTWARDLKNFINFLLFGNLVGSWWYLFGLQRVNECLQDACHNSNLTGCSTFIGCSTGKNSDLWNNNVNVTACLSPSSGGAFPYGIYEDAVPLTTEARIIKKYLFALVWGFQQVISLADNLKPSYNFVLEVGFVMVIMVLGLIFFTLLLGNIQGFLMTLRQRRLEMELRKRDVEQWMNHRRIPEDIRRRVRKAELYNWVATKGANEEMLLENLPENVQIDIRRHLFKFVKKVPNLDTVDEQILDAIYEKLKKKFYIRRSRILSEGDIVEEMVFIVSGELESITAGGTKTLLSDGHVCGEELLTWYLERADPSPDGENVRVPGPRLVSDRTIRCITNVEAFTLRLADLEDVTILFPEFLQNPRVHALRSASPYHSLKATRIQVAWRYMKKRRSRANTSKSDAI